MNDEILLFVEEQAAKLTRGDVAALSSRLPALRERIARIDIVDYPQLAAQYKFMALQVEDGGHFLERHLSEICDREMAFALLYLETEGNVLPDAAPGIGLVDDQAIAETVLYKHREALRHSPRGYLFEWAMEPVDFDRMVLDRLHQRLAQARLNGFGGSSGLTISTALHVAH